MDVLPDRCAGLDIGKKDLKACVRTPSPTGRRSRPQETRHSGVLTTCWKTPWTSSWSTPRTPRACPVGEDVSDSAWLAQLGECGLLKASFVPPEPAGTCVT